MNYSENQLMQKDENEINKIKAAKEVVSIQDRERQDRRRFWQDSSRLLFIAVLTSGITFATGYWFKQRDAAAQREQRLVDRYDDSEADLAVEGDTTVQQTIRERLCTLAIPPNDTALLISRRRHCEKFNAVRDQWQAKLALSAAIPVQDSAALRSELEEEERKELLAKQEQQLASEARQKELAGELAEARELMRLTAERFNATAALEATKVIEQTVRTIEANNTAVESASGTSDGKKSEVLWVKKDYYLIFPATGQRFKVLLTDLAGRNEAAIKVYVLDAADRPTQLKIGTIAKGRPLAFDHAGRHYRVNLEAIDHAGKNPFTLAAYITFETLN